ncbi:MAG: NAD(P)H-dependent oxidoreductase [Deltaproteobacteria bacterium CG11_big_fil_rev_8_21_14_0_20_42_23]|nr:MAG: NAD(P)H-dependent oxidoreductase [Deltaproteobacteria bacterium CG11_big_fil_rev_8_21_14_0_20_42_23]PJC63567.1 MAG: NAD(P)H-dependent oxidoreductase [Deltaproteobacteria bacterium CG_4_9_14_0_2_um_filter_42_21]
MENSLQKTILEQLQWRYATKKFDAHKKISEANWHVLEESLHLCPSSYGLQPWKFLVVESVELRKKLTPASWNQTQVEDCSHFVVLTALTSLTKEYVENYIKRISNVRGTEKEKLQAYQTRIENSLINASHHEAIREWASRQTYIAMGFFLNTAALLNIDTCPMEGIIQEQYDEILNLKNSGYSSVAAIAAGYRDESDALQHAKKVRFEKDDIMVKV